MLGRNGEVYDGTRMPQLIARGGRGDDWTQRGKRTRRSEPQRASIAHVGFWKPRGIGTGGQKRAAAGDGRSAGRSRSWRTSWRRSSARWSSWRRSAAGRHVRRVDTQTIQPHAHSDGAELLNHPNYASPNGDLSSPFFGQSLSLQGGFGPEGPTSTYLRKVSLQLRLTF